MTSDVRGQLIDSDNTILVGDLRVPRSFWQRALGLLTYSGLSFQQGLYLERCRSVHMMGMRFPVDVVFLDADGVVVRALSGVRPWRAASCYRARHTLELAHGVVETLGLRVGQSLKVRIMQ